MQAERRRAVGADDVRLLHAACGVQPRGQQLNAAVTVVQLGHKEGQINLVRLAHLSVQPLACDLID